MIDKDDDGKYWLRRYVFDGTRVRLTGKDPYQPGTSDDGTAKTSPLAVDQMEAKCQWSALKKRLSGD